MSDHRSDFHHEPVLADEVCRYLVGDRDGAYIDATAGLGGHLKALAGAVGERARLYGIDIDGETVAQAREAVKDFPTIQQIYEGSYRDVEAIVKTTGESGLDGILLDLGLSSRQLDDPERGFSFQFDGPLDMRFDRQGRSMTASDLINTADVGRLTDIFRRYGEEKQAARLAREIVRERHREVITTTGRLRAIITEVVPPPHQTKSLARVFQALRIAVNQELEHLIQALPNVVAALKVGGRLALIAYHSLEDRIVKQFFRDESQTVRHQPESLLPDETIEPLLRVITRKPVYPSEQEKSINPRARSARLRVAERVRA